MWLHIQYYKQQIPQSAPGIFLSYSTDIGGYHRISTSLSWFEEQMFFSQGVWFKEALHKHFVRATVI